MNTLQRFKNLLVNDKKDIYQILVYSLLTGLISLSIPLGIQAIVNFIQAGQYSTSWIILVLMVVIGVVFVGVLKIMQFRISENLQQKIFVRASFEFAYRFPKIRFDKLYNTSSIELANRFFDTISVQKGITKLVLEVSTAVLQIFFGVLLLSLYHSFFIFFGFVLLILLYLIFRLNFLNGLNSSLNESKYKYKVAHWLQEIARNYLSFKNGNLFNFSLTKNDNLTFEYLKYREQHFSILRKQFIQLTGFKVLITAGLLIIGGVLVINQKMNIGQFVAAEIIIITIVSAVEKLFYGIELFYDVTTSLEKIGTVTDLELEINTKNTNYTLDNQPIKIETNNLSYQYPNADAPILKNISININPTDRILIQGENGSGKTTLIRLLARLIEPSVGTIFVNDINYKKYSYDDYRSKIGIITTNDTVFEGTIYENITCGNQHITLDAITKVLEKLKLASVIKSLPLGLETPLVSQGNMVNSASLQKILLARCIINQPKILFLEEPVDKIDKKTAIEIIDMLTDASNPWILVVIAKDIYWSSKSTKIITLENGQLI